MTAESNTAENSGPPAPQPAASSQMHFIPVMRADLVAALRDQGLPNDQANDFLTLATFLGAYFHHDFYDELTELKDTYAWFSTSGPRPLRRETLDADTAFAKLITTFESVMTRANFVELPPAEVASLSGDHPQYGVKTRTPLDAYEVIRVFYRGCRTRTITQATTLGFAAREIPLDTFDDVIVFVRFKQPTGQPRKRLMGSNRLPGGAEPGSVMVKSFRNIARIELPMLLPDVQIVMSRRDAVLLGGPALLGGIPIALNLLPALSVILVVIGVYLGFAAGQVGQDKLMKAVGALSALIGAGAFIWRQYSNYSFRKLKYQKKLADNIYFKNINNDVGVFESLISAAEDQEVKEVILAYHSLLTAGPAAHAGELDRRIETWLKATFQMDIDFEVGDALTKLEGLGFMSQKDGKIAAVPINEALTRLDSLWDRLYDFTRGAGVHAAA